VTAHLLPAIEWRDDLPIENTLRLEARADRALVLNRITETVLQSPEIGDWLADPRTLVLGGGSNLVFVSPRVARAVLVHAAEWIAIAQDDETVTVQAEAGMGLDRLVRETAGHGWYGLEALAEIPGTIGAAPVQNVGAYGRELAERVEWVEAWHRRRRCLERLAPGDCAFAYRDSRFKREPGEWLITRVALRLDRRPPAGWPPTGYPGVDDAVREWASVRRRRPADISPAEYADAITAIRRRKLPDWRSGLPGSVGSFFQNPLVSAKQADALGARWPDMPRYPLADGRAKLSAGWLIEQCGWKGFRDDGVGVSPRHALVLLHLGGGTGRSVASLAERIAVSVRERFGVDLVPEPRFVTGSATDAPAGRE